MAATPQQFWKEVGPGLRSFYVKYADSRSDYKEAVERWSVMKMPRATEGDRRKFVAFALQVYDVMKKTGFDPNTPVEEMGRILATKIN